MELKQSKIEWALTEESKAEIEMNYKGEIKFLIEKLAEAKTQLLNFQKGIKGMSKIGSTVANSRDENVPFFDIEENTQSSTYRVLKSPDNRRHDGIHIPSGIARVEEEARMVADEQRR
jgi:hypothetical protein